MGQRQTAGARLSRARAPRSRARAPRSLCPPVREREPEAHERVIPRQTLRVANRSRARATARRSPARAGPTPRTGGAGSGCVEDAVDRAPRGFVGRLHRRQIGVGADVVGGQEQIRNPRDGFGPKLPGVDQIHEQRLFVRCRAVLRGARLGSRLQLWSCSSFRMTMSP